MLLLYTGLCVIWSIPLLCSVNREVKRNPPLTRFVTCFPALRVSYVNLLRALIGSLYLSLFRHSPRKVVNQSERKKACSSRQARENKSKPIQVLVLLSWLVGKATCLLWLFTRASSLCDSLRLATELCKRETKARRSYSPESMKIAFAK